MVLKYYMNWYLFWGSLSSLCFLSAVPAIGHQLWLIYERKRRRACGELQEAATQSISINQVFSSFCGIYSFFLFGIVLDPPDLFLTIPRFIAAVLIYLVVLEIYRERRDRPSTYAMWGCTLLSGIPVALILTGVRTATASRSLSQAVVILATLLMAQGCLAQYRALRLSGQRGGVSFPMHAMLYAKDFTGLMFGMQLGWTAWAIILMHLSNLVMRLPLMYRYSKLPG